MAMLRTSLIALSIHLQAMFIRTCPFTDICHQLKTIHDSTKYAPYLTWSHSEKSKCPLEMNICAFGLILSQQWSGQFHFYKALLVAKDYHKWLKNMHKLVSNGHLAVSPDNLKEIKYIDSFLPQSVTQETQHLCQV